MLRSTSHETPARRPNRFRTAGLGTLLITVFLLPLAVSAQTAGDFRSLTSGSWSKRGTWEEFDGAAWVNTRNTPDGTAGTGVITIRSGHAVTANSTGSYDQVVIEFGATLTLSKAMTIVDGPGTDLVVNGVLNVNNTLTLTGNATTSFSASSQTTIGANDNLIFAGNSSATFPSGSTFSSSGNLQVQNTASVTIEAGITYSSSGDITLADSGQLTFDGSTLVNSGSITATGSSSLIMASGSLYEHAQDGGAFPPSTNTTWATGSSVLVSGVTRTAPTNLDEIGRAHV